MGKYTKDGRTKPILGHNLPLAALGVFILWLGWFGFNPGSTTAANKDIAMIFVNTNLAAPPVRFWPCSPPGSNSENPTSA